VRGPALRPGGKYLISVSNDKSLRFWDLSQGGKLVKTMEVLRERFVTCMRWAPSVVNDNSPEENGPAKKEDASKIRIRCAVAIGGLESTVRVFAL
jgi:platelet-activating factor acetylhydrolase IB subunit alpha